MLKFKPTAEIRSVGITFDEAIVVKLDALAVEAGEDGIPLSRSEVVRRLVLMSLDLLDRNDPVLADYVDPEKTRTNGTVATVAD